jgi:glycosyltransferase involved in cell wall biosynthesis
MVTFIIPAHNEEFLIGRTISAIGIEGGVINEPYEIIVVDDASTVATAAVATCCGARVLSVEYRQIAAARNAATLTNLAEVVSVHDYAEAESLFSAPG